MIQINYTKILQFLLQDFFIIIIYPPYRMTNIQNFGHINYLDNVIAHLIKLITDSNL